MAGIGVRVGGSVLVGLGVRVDVGVLVCVIVGVNEGIGVGAIGMDSIGLLNVPREALTQYWLILSINTHVPSAFFPYTESTSPFVPPLTTE